MKISAENSIFVGANKKKSLYDLNVPTNWNGKLIIFLHGYMGYKDWGCWNLVSDFFTIHSYGFLKYNVSHNGGTTDNPIDFDDLESFSKNSYLNEIYDFQSILHLVEESFAEMPDIYVIGHSRGGGIALLQSDNGLIKKIATWAAIASIDNRFPTGKEFQAWKADRYYFKKNGRTSQQMPHHFSQYESYKKYSQRLNIESYCKNSTVPTLVVHGEQDSSVSIDEGKTISNWLGVDLTVIENENHTFGSSQPWKLDSLPSGLEQVCNETLAFFDEITVANSIEDREKHSLLSDLVKLAESDKKIRDSEFQFLLSIARQLGVTKSNFKRIFEENIEFNPPRLELDRIIQFQRLIHMMNIDLEASKEEINYIIDIGMRLGLHPSSVNEVLNTMNDYPNKVIPPAKLIEIFKAFNN